jgi:hypothetical protein
MFSFLNSSLTCHPSRTRSHSASSMLSQITHNISASIPRAEHYLPQEDLKIYLIFNWKFNPYKVKVTVPCTTTTTTTTTKKQQKHDDCQAFVNSRGYFSTLAHAMSNLL